MLGSYSAHPVRFYILLQSPLDLLLAELWWRNQLEEQHQHPFLHAEASCVGCCIAQVDRYASDRSQTSLDHPEIQGAISARDVPNT